MLNVGEYRFGLSGALHRLALDRDTSDRLGAVQLKGGLLRLRFVGFVSVVLDMHAEAIAAERDGEHRNQRDQGF